jgi:hypothetical protein
MGLLRRAPAWVACAWLAASLPLHALETDQYYAWGRPLRDAGEAVNAKINAELGRALVEANRRDQGREYTCRDVLDSIKGRYTLFIFQHIELWAARTELLDRVPARGEEEAYRRNWIYRDISRFDLGRTVPPSGTIEVSGIRFGTDKLSHFFSEGHWYYKWYETARRDGLSHEAAVELVIGRGIQLETTVLGGVISGVLSPGDLEANYQGLLWYIGLCDGDDPALVRGETGWELRRPFDLRPYVSPEWDESYSPSVVSPSRWVKVRPVVAQYCSRLHDPWVVERRAAYAAMDKETLTETLLARQIAEGKISNPASFGVDAVCATPSQQTASTSPPAGGPSSP